MKLIEQLRLPYLLKEVKRAGKVEGRNETTAEHTFSTLTLAEYFLKLHPKLNATKVKQMILYHDYVEIYAGDTNLLNDKLREKKYEEEDIAFKKLVKELPKEIAKDFTKAWKEYSLCKTKEAKFVSALDALDPMLHSIYQPEEWREHGYTEEKLRKYKEPRLKEFPKLMKFFNELITELKIKKIIPEN